MEFWKGTSTELLKSLHILTRDGKLNADSRRKLKQVYHLTQLIEPMIRKLIQDDPDFTLVDVGAGKSYFGFILYDLILREIGAGKILAIESRAELIEKSKLIANDSQFDRMQFLHSTVEEAKVDAPVHLVCALHACDTATDDAILFGIKHHTRAFGLVPCCQAEAAKLLESVSNESSSNANALYRFPLHRREFGSHLTNVIRTLFLQSRGYKVTVTELVGWEHSLKNELILAEKVSDPSHPKAKEAKEKLDALLKEFPIETKLIRQMSSSL